MTDSGLHARKGLLVGVKSSVRDVQAGIPDIRTTAIQLLKNLISVSCEHWTWEPKVLHFFFFAAVIADWEKISSTNHNFVGN